MAANVTEPWVARLLEEHAHRDDEGRLLREARAPAAAIRAGELEYRPCPYPGSRQGAGPMNVSALRQTSTHWADIVDALAWLRAGYADGVPAATPRDVMDLWRVSQLGSALPWWFILGRDEPAPAYAAALAKATLGVGIWAQRVFVDVLAGAPSPPRFTPRVVLDLAEANGSLVGDDEVCSGPERMLLRFFEALIEGVPAPGRPHLARLEAARDAVLGFGAHYLNFKLALWVHFLARRFVYADVLAAVGDDDELRALVDGPCEPSDFFTVGPDRLAEVPAVARAAWLGSLAAHAVPCAPDRSDQGICEAAGAIAAAMGEPTPRTAAAARSLHARLDQLLGVVMNATEAGFRRAAGAAPPGPIAEGVRDRLIGAAGRVVLARLVPTRDA